MASMGYEERSSRPVLAINLNVGCDSCGWKGWGKSKREVTEDQNFSAECLRSNHFLDIKLPDIPSIRLAGH